MAAADARLTHALTPAQLEQLSTETMCGSCRAAASRISRANRAAERPSAISGAGTLTRTSRPSAR
jgi:hypothetical protein